MKKILYFILVEIFTTSLFAQTAVKEVEMEGKTMVIFSDGTWEEKVYKKPTIVWVSIPAGTFLMGSSLKEANRRDDEAVHEVSLSTFKMSKYEITFDQYDIFCEATKREKPDDEGWGRGNRPVINISWDDATAFAKWMGCRLPTEAEWEYACRAGTKTHFHSGICINTDQVNYDGDRPMDWCLNGEYREKTVPVGSFAPNAFGLFDMHGNVWEWCSDWYGIYPTTAQTNPTGPITGWYRVIRGGSWGSNAQSCRSAYRHYYGPYGNRDNSIGFRVVLLP